MSVYAELAPAAVVSLPMLISLGLLGLAGSVVAGTAKGVYELLTYEDETLKPATPSTPPTTNFQTFFTDGELLKKSFDGICYEEKSGRFSLDFECSHLEFFKGENENYELKIKGEFNLDKLNKFYNDLAHKYEKLVQEQVCESIREKVQNNNCWKIEQEEVLEDESVVITINV